MCSSTLVAHSHGVHILLCGDNTKISSWRSRLYLYFDTYGPLEFSFSLFLSRICFCGIWLLLFVFFIIDRNSLVKTL